MLKVMKSDEENKLFIIEDERGVKRKVFYQEGDNALSFAGGPLGDGSHDDLDELGGIMPELDRTLEECQLALERLQGEQARALREDQLALYLALETTAARLSGHVQGLTFVRERLGDNAPRALHDEGDVLVGRVDAEEAQAKLDRIVRRIETSLARRAEQENLN